MSFQVLGFFFVLLKGEEILLDGGLVSDDLKCFEEGEGGSGKWKSFGLRGEGYWLGVGFV